MKTKRLIPQMVKRSLQHADKSTYFSDIYRIEGNSMYDFHIHTATEHYQDLGAKEDHFAEKTDTEFSRLLCLMTEII
jgi:hypothetical protein